MPPLQWVRWGRGGAADGDGGGGGGGGGVSGGSSVDAVRIAREIKEALSPAQLAVLPTAETARPGKDALFGGPCWRPPCVERPPATAMKAATCEPTATDVRALVRFLLDAPPLLLVAPGLSSA